LPQPGRLQGQGPDCGRRGKAARRGGRNRAAELRGANDRSGRIPGKNRVDELLPDPGVSKQATDEDIKKAYFQLARKFHPDRFSRSASPENRAKIDDVFDKITKAYHTLSNRELRKVYDIRTPVAGDEDKGKDVLKKADTKFRQAKTLYSQGGLRMPSSCSKK